MSASRRRPLPYHAVGARERDLGGRRHRQRIRRRCARRRPRSGGGAHGSTPELHAIIDDAPAASPIASTSSSVAGADARPLARACRRTRECARRGAAGGVDASAGAGGPGVRAARQRLFRPRAAFDGRGQQAAGVLGVAAGERRGAGLQQLFPFALPLGDRAARALDVGAGPRVAAIEEEDARPHADCQLVLSAEIMVEAGEQQLLDSRVGALMSRSGSAMECGDYINAQMPNTENVPC